MDIYKARWENAKRLAEKINSYFDAGYLIFNEYGERVTEKFLIKETWIGSEEIICGNLCYFIRDIRLDNGMYTKISEYNSKFKNWKIVRPEHLVSLF